MTTQFSQMDKIAVFSVAQSQTLTAMTAGTVYTGVLQPAPILDSARDGVGGFNNNSFSATGSVFTNQVTRPDLVLNNGDYHINYASGAFKVKAGASATPVATWYSKAIFSAVPSGSSSPVITTEKLAVIAEGEVTVATAGTPVAIPSNTSAKAVLITNNNVDGTSCAIGLNATVDALSSPQIGRVLNAYDTTIVYVASNSNEVYVDSTTSSRKFTYQILG